MSEEDSSDSEFDCEDLTDEEIFRRKLLMDGEGVGDCRRIDLLLRKVVDFADGTDETPAEIDAAYEKICNIICNIELSFERSEESKLCHERQIQDYKKAAIDIDRKIIQAKKDIIQKKLDLENVLEHQTNKLDRDRLARSVCVYPDRKYSEEKLEHLQLKILSLEEEKESIIKELEEHQKKLSLLLSSVHDINNVYNETESLLSTYSDST